MKSVEKMLNVIHSMKDTNMDLNMTRKYEMDQLMIACNEVKHHNWGELIKGQVFIQSAIVENLFLTEIIDRWTESNLLLSDLDLWIKKLSDNCEKIQNFSVDVIIHLTEMTEKASRLSRLENAIESCYCYLKFFSDKQCTSEKMEKTLYNLNKVEMNINKLQRLISHTDNQVISVMGKMDCDKFLTNQYDEIILLLSKNNNLIELTALTENHFWSYKKLYRIRDLDAETLQYAKVIYETINGSKANFSTLLNRIFQSPSHNLKNDFLWFFSYPEQLNNFEKWSYGEYLDARYAKALKGKISFEDISYDKIPILIHAIQTKKSVFLKMVKENYDWFLNLSDSALIFNSQIYQRCNLNNVTVKHLNEMPISKGKLYKPNLNAFDILSETQYTFEELSLLANCGHSYFRLYNYLSGLRIDSKILIIRQLKKKNILLESYNEEQLFRLSSHLKEKLLDKWMEEVQYIKGITAKLFVDYLCNSDALHTYISDIKSVNELSVLLRNMDRISDFKGKKWREISKEILFEDKDWIKLVEDMKIPEALIKEHKASVAEFLMNNGANISSRYNSIVKNKEAFKRIVTATLIGKFYELKYPADGLNREIGFSVSKKVEEEWQKNRCFNLYGFKLSLVDDFYSTMKLGTEPIRTCLSYIDGSYSECLLAAFDANKKVLYAYKDDQIVSRAFVRLTRSSDRAGSLSFVDVSAEDSDNVKEVLTLFLECPYTAHLNDQEKFQLFRALITAASRIAKEMGAEVMLARDYCSVAKKISDRFITKNKYLYISRSKAGQQYLDSLSGEKTVSDEAKYQKGKFVCKI